MMRRHPEQLNLTMQHSYRRILSGNLELYNRHAWRNNSYHVHCILLLKLSNCNVLIKIPWNLCYLILVFLMRLTNFYNNLVNSARIKGHSRPSRTFQGQVNSKQFYSALIDPSWPWMFSSDLLNASKFSFGSK